MKNILQSLLMVNKCFDDISVVLQIIEPKQVIQQSNTPSSPPENYSSQIKKKVSTYPE